MELSPVHLVIILVAALLVIGPGKLPETGAAIGKAVRDFRHGMTEDVTGSKPVSAGGPTDVAAAAESTPPPSTSSTSSTTSSAT